MKDCYFCGSDEHEMSRFPEVVHVAEHPPCPACSMLMTEVEQLKEKINDERRCRYTEKRAKEEVSREASTLYDDLKYLLEKVSDDSVEILVKRGCSLAVEEYDCRRAGLKEGR